MGGCPFAGVAAGNVATEDVVFLCDRLGVETGVDLAAITECARLAESIVGHQLPSRQAQVAKAAESERRGLAS
jgi:hydroxymethylglutaryl-CoA lyase